MQPIVEGQEEINHHTVGDKRFSQDEIRSRRVLITDDVDHINVSELEIDRVDSLQHPRKATFRSTLNLLLTLNMIKVVALIIVSGLVLAIYSGLLVKLISNTIQKDEDKLTKALYCMIVFGVGEVTGALTLGKVVDIFNNRVGIFCVMIVVVVTISITIYTHSRSHFDVFWFITAF